MMSRLFGDSPLFSLSAFKSISTLPTKVKISPTGTMATGHFYEDDKLNIQLSDAPEQAESEFPSSSLLIASSDFNTELPATSSPGGQLAGVDEDETMGFWSSGLPPHRLLHPLALSYRHRPRMKKWMTSALFCLAQKGLSSSQSFKRVDSNNISQQCLPILNRKSHYPMIR